VQWLWASYLQLCASVTKQYNLVPVKVRLLCDWGVQTELWFVCGWQVKLCDSLVTHGPCLTSVAAIAHDKTIIAALRDGLLVEWFVLTEIKAVYY